jgi:hypothetical protein
MRISFELDIEGSSVQDCRAVVFDKVSEFLLIDSDLVAENVTIELQVKDSEDPKKFKIKAFVKVKQSEK